VLSATVAGIDLAACYFPQGEAKRPVFDFLCEDLAPSRTNELLVIGDLNTGRHRIDEIGATFHCAECFDRLEHVGLIDAWRSRNLRRKEYSWITHAGNGFRIDHAFATGDLNRRITSIDYDHTPRVMGLSDHSALIMQFSEEAGDS